MTDVAEATEALKADNLLSAESIDVSLEVAAEDQMIGTMTNGLMTMR